MVKSWQSVLKERPMLQYSGKQKGLHLRPPSPGETDMQRGLDLSDRERAGQDSITVYSSYVVP